MQHPSPDAPNLARRTGPRTPAGKTRSSKNACKHGLTARTAVLPGEDVEEYEQVVTGVIDSLQPFGAAEAELARVVASALWQLRRSDRWEAARARLAAAADRQASQAGARDLERQMAELRNVLEYLQRDPAADPPLAGELPGLADDATVYPREVRDLYRDWADQLGPADPIPALSDLCREAGLPDEVAKEPLEWDGWQATHVRRLVARFAAIVGQTVDEYLRDAQARWKAELPAERAVRRRRRAEVRREIKELELRREDAAVAGASPDTARVDLLIRYESAIVRKMERVLRALRDLQDARQRGKGRADSGRNGRARR